MTRPELDCIVIGGGPAGLTAAIYLARFRLSLKLIDAGRGRASLIPCTYNHAGFPDGISGRELIERMQRQAQHYGAVIEQGRVTRLERCAEGFAAEWGGGTVTARTVLIATGVTNRRPSIDENLHDEALARGLIRYCPVCDGYEVTDKNIAVIGSGEKGTAEAIFLRSYTAEVALIAADGPHALAERERRKLDEAGVRLIDGPCHVAAADEQSIFVETAEGRLAFASIYPALGSDTHTDLAQAIGARVAAKDSCLIVDDHQRCSVPGVYAAGDVVLGLDQISHAMGQGGIAATTIRNDIARDTPLLRPRQ